MMFVAVFATSMRALKLQVWKLQMKVCPVAVVILQGGLPQLTMISRPVKYAREPSGVTAIAWPVLWKPVPMVARTVLYVDELGTVSITESKELPEESHLAPA